MSTAAATELAESLTRTGGWVELTPDGGERTGVLAALPTVTEVSRCSLLSGRIAVGAQPVERAAFEKRFPTGILLHKASLRAVAGAALDRDVLAALDSPHVPIVAAVINTIDDALDRSHPGTIVWSEETVGAVRDLLLSARDRVVVLVSDHGHVVDRGPEAVVRKGETSENRWRPASTSVDPDREVAISGSRVALGGGSVVLPWREELRYGPRKAGYHGGAAPAEAVIPLLMLTSAADSAIPGWAGAPVASPDWWREPLVDPAATSTRPGAVTGNGGRGKKPRQEAAQLESLFDLVAPSAVPPAAPEPAAPPRTLVDALLASELYAQRRGTRAPLPDDRVAALLGALLAGGGRATLDTLAAHAGIPAHRIGLTVTALRKLLQVEGYPVVTLDPDGQTVKLDVQLMVEQFHLGQQ